MSYFATWHAFWTWEFWVLLYAAWRGLIGLVRARTDLILTAVRNRDSMRITLRHYGEPRKIKLRGAEISQWSFHVDRALAELATERDRERRRRRYGHY